MEPPALNSKSPFFIHQATVLLEAAYDKQIYQTYGARDLQEDQDRVYDHS
jgi:hypothetical protein